MKKIFEISDGGFELKLHGDNQSEKLHDPNFFFPVVIELYNGAFGAKKKIEMEIGYIETFVKDLEGVYKNLKGAESRLENLDMDFSILFESNEPGQINISGVLFDGEIRQNKLEINTQIDQAKLSLVIKDSNDFMEQK